MQSTQKRNSKPASSLTSKDSYGTPLNSVENTVPKISSKTILIVGTLLALAVAVAINYTTTYPPIIIVSGALGLILFVAILQNPELGSYILIFSVFTNLSDLFTEKGLPSINKPLVAIILLGIFVNYIFRTGKLSPAPRITRIELALLAYCTVIFASSFVAVNQPRSFSYIFDLMKDIAVGGCVYLTLNTRKKWENGVSVLIFAITFVSILGVIHTLTGSEQTFWGFAQQSAFGQRSANGDLRFGGPIGESNIWGQVLVSTIPLVLYRIVKERRQAAKFVYFLASLFILLCVFYTQSRGAFLALAVTLVLIAFEIKIKSSNLLFIAVLSLIALSILPSQYTERIRSLQIFFKPDQEYGLTQDESVVGRRNKMLTGLAMYRANPLLGVGFANYTDNYFEYAEAIGVESNAQDIEVSREPHSLYIEIMAETGTLGILTFMGFLGFLFISMYQIRKRYLKSKSNSDADWAPRITAIMFSLFTFLVAGFFLHGIGFRYIWVLAGMALATIHIANIETNQNQVLQSHR